MVQPEIFLDEGREATEIPVSRTHRAGFAFEIMTEEEQSAGASHQSVQSMVTGEQIRTSTGRESTEGPRLTTGDWRLHAASLLIPPDGLRRRVAQVKEELVARVKTPMSAAVMPC